MVHGNQSEALPPGPPVQPRDAATLLIVDTTGGAPRILMGRRRSDDVFMPDKFVFPGGRVELDDAGIPSADELHERCAGRLLVDIDGEATPARARAIALAAIRETFEEAGIIIGAKGSWPQVDGALPHVWAEFQRLQILPRLGVLSFVARAITPAHHKYRYDGRFFCVPASAIVHQTQISDGELIGLDWFTIPQIRALDLPSITRVVVEQVNARLLANGTLSDAPVPFYPGGHDRPRRTIPWPSPDQP
jgi:8-oxo-dGTP pyrophosphatase MutT (NUDIX family)